MHLAGSDSRKSCFGPWPACHNPGNPQISLVLHPPEVSKNESPAARELIGFPSTTKSDGSSSKIPGVVDQKIPQNQSKVSFIIFAKNIHYDVHCGCGVFLVEAAEDLCGWPGTPPPPIPAPTPHLLLLQECWKTNLLHRASSSAFPPPWNSPAARQYALV